MNNINISNLRCSMEWSCIYKLKYKHQNHSSFFRALLLSGDIQFNPGPTINKINEDVSWEHFKNRGLHFIHLNINSLLPKIDELRDIAKLSNASVIGITESKLDESVSDSEISIQGYDVVRNDRNRHGGGVVCYVKNNLSYNVKKEFENDIENIIIDIFLPKTKPITVVIFYRPPHQTNILDRVSESLDKLNLENSEVYILGDLNINLFYNEKYIYNNTNNIRNIQNLSPETKRYVEFCSFFGLKQLIKTPTRITCNTSTLIDHIITNFADKVSQAGVIDIGISDHQLIYCTRKVNRLKPNKHKEINIRSLKNYTPESFREALGNDLFPNYEEYTDTNTAYNDFVTRLQTTINDIAPLKSTRIKNTTPEWFDGEIADKISNRDKLFKKFKSNKLEINK